MNRYSHKKKHVLELTSQVGTPLKTGTGKPMPYFDHPRYPELINEFADINEFAAVNFYKTDIADHPVVAIPVFIDGFHDDFIEDHKRILGKKVINPRNRIGHKEFLHRKLWKKHHFEKLYAIDPFQLGVDKTLKSMLDIALDMIKPHSNLFLPSGPITTGGHGSREANLKTFNRGIINAAGTGLTVFNAMPFQSLFATVHELSKSKGADKYKGRMIMDKFYVPIIKTKKFSTLLQFNKWETSEGCKVEHETSLAHNMVTKQFYDQPLIPKDEFQPVYN